MLYGNVYGGLTTVMWRDETNIQFGRYRVDSGRTQ